MRKRVIALVCMLTTGLLIWKMPEVLTGYPANRDGTIRQRGWQGVLRVWVCQDWSSSAMGWITKQAAAFEKARKGVRVSIRRVPSGAWESEDAVLPDVLIFSPGMVSEPRGLLHPFGGTEEFLSEAVRSGRWAGEQYALPLALGGYAVLINEAMWPEGAALVEPGPVKKQQRYAIHSPTGGALAALLGWEAGVEAARVLSRPEGFGSVQLDSAYSAFVGGNVAALVCTIDQTRKFGALVAAGRGFDYRVETPLSGFCDLTLLIGKMEGEADRARDAAVSEFIWAVTGKTAQDSLLNIGLIPVRNDAAKAGEVTPVLKALQERYQTELVAPNAFGWATAKDEFVSRALHSVLKDGGGFNDAVEQVR
ncbi:MAG: hypothetical protein LBK46_03375 [Oscillospiraceae bacterium]|jgi:hypothetical protein|nr:hypothetical protein [Oscillospiraceae bacterium]